MATCCACLHVSVCDEGRVHICISLCFCTLIFFAYFTFVFISVNHVNIVQHNPLAYELLSNPEKGRF